MKLNKQKAKSTSLSEPQPLEVSPQPIETVAIADIVIPRKHREADDEIVSQIAESIRVNGLLHPISIRRRKVKGKPGREIVLVDGVQRLKAAQLAGLKEVPFIRVKGGKSRARLVTIDENVFRKELTVLERSEQIVERTQIDAKRGISGQVVQKPKRAGRPEGGVSLTARKMFIPEKTEEARRKDLERARAIVSISPDVKEAAKKSNLDNNQVALLAIAKETTPLAQMTKLEQQRTRTAPRAARKLRVQKTKKVASAITYEQLVAAWSPSKLKKIWRHATFEARERFINEILHGPKSGSSISVRGKS